MTNGFFTGNISDTSPRFLPANAESLTGPCDLGESFVPDDINRPWQVSYIIYMLLNLLEVRIGQLLVEFFCFYRFMNRATGEVHNLNKIELDQYGSCQSAENIVSMVSAIHSRQFRLTPLIYFFHAAFVNF